MSARYSKKVLRICRAVARSKGESPWFYARVCLLGVSAAAFGGTPPAWSQTVRTGDAGAVERALIPLPNLGISMATRIVRPPGAGPFSLVVINHASTESAERRALLPEP